MPLVAGLLLYAHGAHTVVAQSQARSGESLFLEHCSGCHNDAPEARAPAPEVLKQRSPTAILDALASGPMRVQGATLSGPQRRAIAEYLGGTITGDATGATVGRCDTPARLKLDSGPAWNGWGASLANERRQSLSAAGLSAQQLPQLELKWAFGFPDATSSWAQPTVVGGWVFVGSQNGTVYALDASSGCIHWFFSADGGVRSAISVGPGKGGAAVYFGDTAAHAYALDATSGRLLWKTQVESHPLARITGAPALYRGRLYVSMSSYEESQGARPDYGCCTFRGSVSSLDASTGKLLWRTYMIADEPRERGKSSSGVTLYGPAGASIWSSPTIDSKRGLIYVGTGNTYAGAAAPASDAVVALKLSGKIKWVKQLYPKDVFITGCRAKSQNPNCADQSGPDYDFGNSPILATLANGRNAIVIGQKSGLGWALDPENDGAVLWQYRAGAGGALGGIEWGSAVDETHAYFAVSDIFSAAPGGLHAVNLQTGERAWYAPPLPPKCIAGRLCSAAQAAAISVIPGAVFSGSNDGTLRAYSTLDGTILWEVDTDHEFQTVNGVAAKGASMLGPGPTIAGGMLFVPSGYGGFGGRPGNVLLAFGLPLKPASYSK
ncbi:MAG TPA: PQQ-binding-like beta-propeller repeat protein [Steroidobacteraceae bacterium]|jgi:polyvinyl alcohol dehydrogenase (cytochrome)